MNKNGKKIKIGYTTGVFDMFHVGHLNILKQAKAQCDYLVVGVSTDELVLEYKNRRPIIPFEDRKTIIEAIRYVDEVIPQTTLNKIDAWEVVKFDVMFHGSDWKNSLLYDKIAKDMLERKVELIFIDYTKKVSSSILRTKIIDND